MFSSLLQARTKNKNINGYELFRTPNAIISPDYGISACLRRKKETVDPTRTERTEETIYFLIIHYSLLLFSGKILQKVFRNPRRLVRLYDEFRC
jgi:hypothetical protein